MLTRPPNRLVLSARVVTIVVSGFAFLGIEGQGTVFPGFDHVSAAPAVFVAEGGPGIIVGDVAFEFAMAPGIVRGVVVGGDFDFRSGGVFLLPPKAQKFFTETICQVFARGGEAILFPSLY